MTATVDTVAATVASDLKAFRSAAVTADNKATPFARSLLAALVAGTWTPNLAVSAIITAFGNPKSPKSGKPIEKLSGLRDFAAGDAVRKTAETAFNIFANIDIDAPREVEKDGETVTVGAGAIRPLIVAFILESNGSAKSLRALDALVKAAIKVHADAISEDNSDAESETEQEGKELANAGNPAPTVELSLMDRLNGFKVALDAASDDDFLSVINAMNDLYAETDARMNRISEETMPEAQAA